MYDPERALALERRQTEALAESLQLQNQANQSYAQWHLTVTQSINHLDQIEEDIRNCFDSDEEEKLRQEHHDLSDLIERAIESERQRRFNPWQSGHLSDLLDFHGFDKAGFDD